MYAGGLKANDIMEDDTTVLTPSSSCPLNACELCSLCQFHEILVEQLVVLKGGGNRVARRAGGAPNGSCGFLALCRGVRGRTGLVRWSASASDCVEPPLQCLDNLRSSNIAARSASFSLRIFCTLISPSLRLSAAARAAVVAAADAALAGGGKGRCLSLRANDPPEQPARKGAADDDEEEGSGIDEVEDIAFRFK